MDAGVLKPPSLHVSVMALGPLVCLSGTLPTPGHPDAIASELQCRPAAALDVEEVNVIDALLPGT